MVDMPDVEKDPSIGVSYNVDMGGRSLVLQTFVARDSDVKVLNGTLDKLRTASERQVAFFALEKAKLELAGAEKRADDHAKRMAQVDENIKHAWNRSHKRGDPVLSQKERADQQQAYANAEALKEIIATHKRNIADFEAIIGA